MLQWFSLPVHVQMKQRGQHTQTMQPQDFTHKQIHMAVVARLQCLDSHRAQHRGNGRIPQLYTLGNNYLSDVWVCVLNAGKACVHIRNGICFRLHAPN